MKEKSSRRKSEIPQRSTMDGDHRVRTTTTVTTKTTRRSTGTGQLKNKYIYEEDSWEKLPKTDYTYIESATYTPQLPVDGYVSPNMSRRGLHGGLSAVTAMSSLDESMSRNEYRIASSSASRSAASTPISPTRRIKHKLTESEARHRNCSLDLKISDSCTRSGCNYGSLQQMGKVSEHSRSCAAMHDESETHQMRYQESYMEQMNESGYDKHLEYSGQPALYKEKSLSNLYGLDYSDGEQSDDENVRWRRKKSRTHKSSSESSLFTWIVTTAVTTTSTLWSTLVSPVAGWFLEGAGETEQSTGVSHMNDKHANHETVRDIHTSTTTVTNNVDVTHQNHSTVSSTAHTLHESQFVFLRTISKPLLFIWSILSYLFVPFAFIGHSFYDKFTRIYSWLGLSASYFVPFAFIGHWFYDKFTRIYSWLGLWASYFVPFAFIGHWFYDKFTRIYSWLCLWTSYFVGGASGTTWGAGAWIYRRIAKTVVWDTWMLSRTAARRRCGLCCFLPLLLLLPLFLAGSMYVYDREGYAIFALVRQKSSGYFGQVLKEQTAIPPIISGAGISDAELREKMYAIFLEFYEQKESEKKQGAGISKQESSSTISESSSSTVGVGWSQEQLDSKMQQIFLTLYQTKETEKAEKEKIEKESMAAATLTEAEIDARIEKFVFILLNQKDAERVAAAAAAEAEKDAEKTVAAAGVGLAMTEDEIKQLIREMFLMLFRKKKKVPTATLR